MEFVKSQSYLFCTRSRETETNGASFHSSSSTSVILLKPKTKTWDLISSPCTKTTLEDLIAACLKHDNYAVSSPAFPFLCLIVLFTPLLLPCFLQITLVSPHAVSSLSPSPTVTHSIILDCFIRYLPSSLY